MESVYRWKTVKDQGEKKNDPAQRGEIAKPPQLVGPSYPPRNPHEIPAKPPRNLHETRNSPENLRLSPHAMGKVEAWRSSSVWA